jgi:hypothetical protein
MTAISIHYLRLSHHAHNTFAFAVRSGWRLLCNIFSHFGWLNRKSKRSVGASSRVRRETARLTKQNELGSSPSARLLRVQRGGMKPPMCFPKMCFEEGGGRERRHNGYQFYFTLVSFNFFLLSYSVYFYVSALSVQTAFLLLFPDLFPFLAGVLRVGRYIQEL